jgi:hypothetical protein
MGDGRLAKSPRGGMALKTRRFLGVDGWIHACPERCYSMREGGRK